MFIIDVLKPTQYIKPHAKVIIVHVNVLGMALAWFFLKSCLFIFTMLALCLVN